MPVRSSALVLAFALLAVDTACNGSRRTLGEGSGTQGETSGALTSSSTGLGGSDASMLTDTGDGTGDGTTTSLTTGEVGNDTISLDIGTRDPSCDFPLGCRLGPSVVMVEEGITPSGPLPVMYAAFGHELCSSGLLVALSTTPLDVGGEFQPPREGVQIWLLGPKGLDVYEGTFEAGFLDCERGSCAYEVGELEFLEPFVAVSLCDPDELPRLHARAELHDAGWSFAVEFEASYCDELSQCFCPCE